jgi:hypothetical protein
MIPMFLGNYMSLGNYNLQKYFLKEKNECLKNRTEHDCIRNHNFFVSIHMWELKYISILTWHCLYTIGGCHIIIYF